MDPGRADISRLGSLLTSKTPSRSDQKIHQFFNRFFNPFWCQFGSQNDFQNHTKSFKNQSKTASGLKNVIFRKMAPRLGETLILEGPGSPKPSQNQQKTLQKPIKNPTKNSIMFSIDLLMMLALFGHPVGLTLGAKIR